MAAVGMNKKKLACIYNDINKANAGYVWMSWRGHMLQFVLQMLTKLYLYKPTIILASHTPVLCRTSQTSIRVVKVNADMCR